MKLQHHRCGAALSRPEHLEQTQGAAGKELVEPLVSPIHKGVDRIFSELKSSNLASTSWQFCQTTPARMK